jgi:tRNA/tmRNA/rRNA uracil-C5-methylase (TrmA/RlmC/RlmD family)
VGHLDDGRVVFVRLALPGERVVAELVDVRARYARAEAVEIVEASTSRVGAPCPHAGAGRCGGCDLQHASASAQLEWKAFIVNDHLARIGKIDREVEVVPADEPARHSRVRLRCAVDDAGHLGLRRARSRDVVSLNDCWLADQRLEGAFSHRWDGFGEVELRAIGDGPAFAVGTRPDGERVALTLEGAMDPPTYRSTVKVGARTFDVSAESFWQSHRSAPSTLTRSVVRHVDPDATARVVDLYSGVGLFAVAIASQAGPRAKVDAVESSLSAVADLRRNARDLSGVRAREWSVTARAVNDLVYDDSVVVLDPPRSGAGAAVISAICRRQARRIVYVSCDSATFARDVRVALDAGYRLETLEAHDLFPMTEHVELVGVLDAPPR